MSTLTSLTSQICAILYSGLCIGQSKWGLGLDIKLRPKMNINNYSIVSNPLNHTSTSLLTQRPADQLRRPPLLHDGHPRLQSSPLLRLPTHNEI